MTRYNYHRRDESHREIVSTLEALGCTVRDLSQLGDKGSDLLVGLLGHDYQVECKSGKETLSAEQCEFYSGWRGHHVAVLHDALEAEHWVRDKREGLTRELFRELPPTVYP